MTEPTPGPKPSRTAASDLVQPLTEHVRALTAAVKQDGTERRRQMRWVLGVCSVLLLLLVINVTVLFQNRQRGLQTAEVIRNSAATSQQIADCTNVGGKCYQEGQRRTAAVLVQLLDGYKIVAQCAKVTNTDDELDVCVDQRLKDAATAASPSAPATPKPTPSTSPTPSAAQDEDVTP